MTQSEQRASNLALVTGAASGMGEAAAFLMRDAGWDLLLCDLNAERLQSTADRLGGASATLAADITDPAFSERLAAAVDDKKIGALIHCAGLSPTMADAARILDVNLAATMRLVDAVLPLLADGGSAVLFASTAAHMIGDRFDEQIGKVTRPEDVASLAALSDDPGMAYSFSKRGVQLLVQRRAPDFGRRGGGRLTSISPGIIDTPMGRAEMEGHPVMQQLVEVSALKRPARAEEVAAVAAFLCSPAASFVTGIDILVDGGSIAGTKSAAAA